VGEDVVLRVPVLLEIAGTLSDGEGNAVKKGNLALVAADGTTVGVEVGLGSDGRFRFPPVPAGEYEIRLQGATIAEGVRAGDTALDLRATAGGFGLLHVKDAAGNSIHKAYVEVTYADGTGGTLDTLPAPISRSRGGVRRIAVVRPQGPGDSVLPLQPVLLTDLDPNLSSWTVVLQPGRRLEVRVQQEDGTGVPGLLVGYSGPPSAPPTSHILYGNETTPWTTDRDGVVLREDLPDGEVRVYVSMPAGYVPGGAVVVPAGETRVVVTLRPGGRVRGRVLDADGKGSSGARVSATFLWEGSFHERSATTEVDGGFVVEGVPEGAVTDLRVVPAGWSGGLSPWMPARAEGIPGGATGVTVRLERGIRIEGQVLDPDGSPASDGLLRLVEARPVRGLSVLSQLRVRLRAGTEGRFAIDGIPPGRYLLHAEPARKDLAPADPVGVSGSVREVRLTFNPEARLAGRILSDTKGFILFWYGSTVPQTNVYSDESGRFVFSGLKDEPGRLLVQRNGDDRYALLEGVRPGDAPLEVTLSVGHQVRGKLLGYDPARPPNVVLLLHRDLMTFGAPIQPDGTFVARGIPPGSYLLEASVPGASGPYLRLPVESGTGGHEIPLPPR
jgi:hypothetical protein